MPPSVRRDELQDLAHGEALRPTVVSVPEPEGDGWLAKGIAKRRDDILAWVRKATGVR